MLWRSKGIEFIVDRKFEPSLKKNLENDNDDVLRKCLQNLSILIDTFCRQFFSVSTMVSLTLSFST